MKRCFEIHGCRGGNYRRTQRTHCGSRPVAITSASTSIETNESRHPARSGEKGATRLDNDSDDRRSGSSGSIFFQGRLSFGHLFGPRHPALFRCSWQCLVLSWTRKSPSSILPTLKPTLLVMGGGLSWSVRVFAWPPFRVLSMGHGGCGGRAVAVVRFLPQTMQIRGRRRPKEVVAYFFPGQFRLIQSAMRNSGSVGPGIPAKQNHRRLMRCLDQACGLLLKSTADK